MAWVKLDTGYLDNPKLIGLHPKTVLLHVASILWTAEHLTDGFVPDHVLSTLSSRVDLASNRRRSSARSLVERGLWDVVPPPHCGWVVHDFTTHNRTSTRAFVEHERELTRERMRKMRAQ